MSNIIKTQSFQEIDYDKTYHTIAGEMDILIQIPMMLSNVNKSGAIEYRYEFTVPKYALRDSYALIFVSGEIIIDAPQQTGMQLIEERHLPLLHKKNSKIELGTTIAYQITITKNETLKFSKLDSKRIKWV